MNCTAAQVAKGSHRLGIAGLKPLSESVIVQRGIKR
jgi:hypothetical protein